MSGGGFNEEIELERVACAFDYKRKKESTKSNTLMGCEGD